MEYTDVSKLCISLLSRRIQIYGIWQDITSTYSLLNELRPLQRNSENTFANSVCACVGGGDTEDSN